MRKTKARGSGEKCGTDLVACFRNGSAAKRGRQGWDVNCVCVGAASRGGAARRRIGAVGARATSASGGNGRARENARANPGVRSALVARACALRRSLVCRRATGCVPVAASGGGGGGGGAKPAAPFGPVWAACGAGSAACVQFHWVPVQTPPQAHPHREPGKASARHRTPPTHAVCARGGWRPLPPASRAGGLAAEVG